MNALKAIVVIMGILIVIGSTVVVFTIFNRLSTRGGEDNGISTEATTNSPGFGARDLDLPAGTRITTTTADRGRLFLEVRLPSGEQRVLVVDPTTGETLGSLRIPVTP